MNVFRASLVNNDMRDSLSFCSIFLWSCYLRIFHLTLIEWDGKLSPVTK
jgi:hypothetical protein